MKVFRVEEHAGIPRGFSEGGRRLGPALRHFGRIEDEGHFEHRRLRKEPPRPGEDLQTVERTPRVMTKIVAEHFDARHDDDSGETLLERFGFGTVVGRSRSDAADFGGIVVPIEVGLIGKRVGNRRFGLPYAPLCDRRYRGRTGRGKGAVGHPFVYNSPPTCFGPCGFGCRARRRYRGRSRDRRPTGWRQINA